MDAILPWLAGEAVEVGAQLHATTMMRLLIGSGEEIAARLSDDVEGEARGFRLIRVRLHPAFFRLHREIGWDFPSIADDDAAIAGRLGLIGMPTRDGLLMPIAIGLARALRRHWRVVSLVSGGLLVAFGALLVSGELVRLTTQLSRFTGWQI